MTAYSSGFVILLCCCFQLCHLRQVSECSDKPDRRIGVPDCSSLKHLCRHSMYSAIMFEQCPKTCNRCTVVSAKPSTIASGCRDKLNSKTSSSDFSSHRYFCENPTYFTLMKSKKNFMRSRTLERGNSATRSSVFARHYDVKPGNVKFSEVSHYSKMPVRRNTFNKNQSTKTDTMKHRLSVAKKTSTTYRSSQSNKYSKGIDAMNRRYNKNGFSRPNIDNNGKSLNFQSSKRHRQSNQGEVGISNTKSGTAESTATRKGTQLNTELSLSVYEKGLAEPRAKDEPEPISKARLKEEVGEAAPGLIGKEGVPEKDLKVKAESMQKGGIVVLDDHKKEAEPRMEDEAGPPAPALKGEDGELPQREKGEAGPPASPATFEIEARREAKFLKENDYSSSSYTISNRSTRASGSKVQEASNIIQDVPNTGEARSEARSDALHAQVTDNAVDDDDALDDEGPAEPGGYPDQVPGPSSDTLGEEDPLSSEEPGSPGSNENTASGGESLGSNGGEIGGSNNDNSESGKNGSTSGAGDMSGGGGASASQGNASSDCHDKLNPTTGTSDCPALRYLCNHPSYYALMTDQCPKTCGKCNDGTVATGEECFDRVNPRTGKTECPALRYLCNHPIYHPLMREQCPRTCDTCTTQPSAAECRDLANPLTGVSECQSKAYLCTNPIYRFVMEVQCPKTCNFCR